MTPPDVDSIRAAFEALPEVERRALLFELFFAEQARATAAELARALRGGGAEFVDQHTSPVGARRFISAIRSGKLRGTRAGRRWLAAHEDHERWLATLAGGDQKPKRSAVSKPTITQELERELRLVGGHC